MKTNKLKLDNVVEVTYVPERDKNNFHNTYLTAMVSVPEESLPPKSEDEKKRGRLLEVYFEKAVEIHAVPFIGWIDVALLLYMALVMAGTRASRHLIDDAIIGKDGKERTARDKGTSRFLVVSCGI